MRNILLPQWPLKSPLRASLRASLRRACAVRGLLVFCFPSSFFSAKALSSLSNPFFSVKPFSSLSNSFLLCQTSLFPVLLCCTSFFSNPFLFCQTPFFSVQPSSSLSNSVLLSHTSFSSVETPFVFVVLVCQTPLFLSFFTHVPSRRVLSVNTCDQRRQS